MKIFNHNHKMKNYFVWNTLYVVFVSFFVVTVVGACLIYHPTIKYLSKVKFDNVLLNVEEELNETLDRNEKVLETIETLNLSGNVSFDNKEQVRLLLAALMSNNHDLVTVIISQDNDKSYAFKKINSTDYLFNHLDNNTNAEVSEYWDNNKFRSAKNAKLISSDNFYPEWNKDIIRSSSEGKLGWQKFFVDAADKKLHFVLTVRYNNPLENNKTMLVSIEGVLTNEIDDGMVHKLGEKSMLFIVTDKTEIIKIEVKDELDGSPKDQSTKSKNPEPDVVTNQMVLDEHARLDKKRDFGEIRSSRIQGKTWFYQFNRLEKFDKEDWLVGLYAPESEVITTDIYWWQTIIFSMFIIFVLAGFITARISTVVVSPLKMLVILLGKFKSLDFDRKIKFSSAFEEINNVLETAEAMRQSLKNTCTQVYSINEYLEENNKKLISEIADFEAMFKSVNAIIYIKDEKGRFKFVNRGWEKLYLVDAKQCFGKSADEVIPDFCNMDFMQLDERVIKERISLDGQNTFHINYKEKKLYYLKFPLFSHNMTVLGMGCIAFDTSKVFAELNATPSHLNSENEESILLFQSLLDNSNVVFVVKDLNGRYKIVNDYFLKTFGLNREDVIGKTDFDLWERSEAEMYTLTDKAAINSSVPLQQNEIVTIDGVTRTYLDVKYTIKDKQGKPYALCVVATEITEIIQVQEELKAAKIAADDANVTKSAFLANMSHEIRTPMNAIIGMINLCMMTDLDPKQKDYMNKINIAAKSLLEIINDILDFSKVEAGKIKIEDTQFDLRELVQNVISVMDYNINKKGLKFNLELDPKLPSIIQGDPTRISQIITNLLNNAIKFTEKGSVKLKVAVSYFTDKTIELKIEVKDTGIGIPSDKLDKLFKPFTQADQTMSRRYGGTGLGLVIVKQLTELMGGVISVESKENEGSTFTVMLELKRPKIQISKMKEQFKDKNVLLVDPEPVSRFNTMKYLTEFGFDVLAESQLVDFDTIMAKMIDVLIIDSKAVLTESFITIKKILGKNITIIALAEPEDYQRLDKLGITLIIKPITASMLFDTLVTISRPVTHMLTDAKSYKDFENNVQPFFEKVHNKTILIVEDNEINMQVAYEMALRIGLKADTAENGVQALNKIKQNKYDLILMDIQMPIMDGLEATKLLRESPEYKNLPIIAMTANAMEGDRERFIAGGLTDYISKPVDPNVFNILLSKYLLKTESLAEEVQSVSKDINPEKNTQISTPDPSVESVSHVEPSSGDIIVANTSKEKYGIIFKNYGVDFDSSIERVMGNVEVYLSLVCRYFSTNKHEMEKIQELIGKQDWENAKYKIHAFKGVSLNLGFVQLGKIALNLENKLSKEIVSESLNLATELKAQFSIQYDSLYPLVCIYENESGVHTQSSIDKENTKGSSSQNDLMDALKVVEFMLIQGSTEAIKHFGAIEELLLKKIDKDNISKMKSALKSYDFETALELCRIMLTILSDKKNH